MKNLKQALFYDTLLVIIFILAACSSDNFTAIQPGVGSSQCTTGGCSGQSFNYSYTVASNQTDVLFVDDNSASMFSLQKDLANRFPTFFNTIQNLDYHIGIVNTDISTDEDPTDNNASRTTITPSDLPYTQDGNLIAFPDGSSFLTKQSANAQAQFQETITRQETLDCENYISTNCNLAKGCSDQAAYYLNCPTEDTRAIYAANLAVSRGAATGFIRDASVPLNIVILSNSDERASGGNSTTAALPQEPNDLASTLIGNVQSLYPGKKLEVHSIIIRPYKVNPAAYPEGKTCLASQDFALTLFGWYGVDYASLSTSTGGIVGNICATDYSPILANIATTSITDDGSRDLPCEPQTGTLAVTLAPAISDSHSVVQGSTGTWRIEFASPLPSNTTVSIAFTCM